MKKTVKKRAFISAIAMLIVSAIVLTSSTFAWFSMSKEAEVSAMDLNITTADGISISANTHKFGTTVTTADIIPDAATAGKGLAADADHTNRIPELMAPSSSDFQLVGGFPVFYNGSIGEDKLLSVTKLANDYSPLSKIVVFDLFVQVSNANTTVKLVGSSIVSEDEGVAKAMRVGFVNCGYKEFSERDDAKTITTDAQYNTAMWVVDGSNAPCNYIASGCGDRTGMPLNADGTSQFFVTTSKAGNQCTNTDADGFNFVAQKGVNRIRVYLWLEGNDVDCSNDIAGSNFTFNLKLSID